MDGAIAAAHSWITGAPQLLPSTSVVTPPSNPSQIFISADLPIDSQDKIWNEEFVDFGTEFRIQVQNSEAGTPASFCLEPV